MSSRRNSASSGASWRIWGDALNGFRKYRRKVEIWTASVQEAIPE